ncbi:MAG TPA: alpha-hydroxy-acid oxidizing protein [Candidatus Dormibacteraeota bacterium]|nr:alpha-hydroxy-acid oxidizing protein [Candidatus Dormibacteraeota bacterium]
MQREMSFPVGPATQAEIYVGGADELPLDPDEWESRAKAVLEPGPFDYVAGGAGGESTMRANLDAFARWRLRPAMLAGNRERDLRVSVLGTVSPTPFLLAPIGVLSAAHSDGDLAVARAAAATGVPWVVSTAASTPMETIAEAMGAAPRWYQLYWVNDREVVASLLQRAEAAGYAAIVLTLDTLQLGWRVRDLRHAYLPFILGEGIAQFTSDPVFRSRLSVSPEEDPRGAGAAMVGMFSNLGLRWDDLAWLRERTRLPLLAKGVLRADDARRVMDAGFQGVIVSNHGGRQVDGAVAALDALVEVRDALGDNAVVLMDGGIRRGADVIKALALGANAVLLGRPYVYGLAVGGQAGVERVIRQLMAEIDLTLALIGGHDVKDLDRSWITLRP